ncbi:phage major capsid protein [Clostridium tyrobutyricum]|uniref:phage major capsid protein n=1 Tax=Clostridium tyrobutyricum TaxID=1519 RepID=UPI001C393A97|nr:phage major capsid protein [Clostridium tyrobutyricum]MBV4417200.1 phage major capsid protein [Clostridium tyrobutyricum]
MSKELRELFDKMRKAQDNLQQIMKKEDRTVDEIKAATSDLKDINAQIEAQKLIDEGKEFSPDGTELSGNSAKQQKEDKEQKKSLYKGAFLNAIRQRGSVNSEDQKILDAMTPSTPADGGLLVPQDIQTSINQYKRTLAELEPLINSIPVTTSSGSRVFEKIATMTPLENITDDTADINDMGSPQFENITYAIKDYAGWMPVPNDLLNDSDQNITDYLTQWIGRKSVLTRNTLILDILNTLSKTAFADWKAIKKAINVQLDPMLSAGANIITNQDGYQYLDTLTDEEKRPLLQPDVQNPGGNKLFGKSIIVVPNSTLTTTGTDTKLAPLIVGNLVELITMFERQGHQIASTNIGGTAFRKNRTEIRVIEREDVKMIDKAAAVYGQVDVTTVV